MFHGLFVSLSLLSIAACLHSRTPHDTSLTIIPPSLNQSSIHTILASLITNQVHLVGLPPRDQAEGKVGQPRQVVAAARERVRRPAVRVLLYYCSSSFSCCDGLLVSLDLILPACILFFVTPPGTSLTIISSPPLNQSIDQSSIDTILPLLTTSHTGTGRKSTACGPSRPRSSW